MFATCNAAAPYAVEERLVSGDTRWVAIRAWQIASMLPATGLLGAVDALRLMAAPVDRLH